MTIKETIQKAIEGGYYGYPKPSCLECGCLQAIESKYQVIFLDPLFWKSLGKTMRWGWLCQACGKRVVSDDGGCKNDDCEGSDNAEYEEWLFWWHRLIDHLVEGKDIQSFFNQFEI